MSVKINNYKEYTTKLIEFFDDINEMPPDEIIQSFIDEFNLSVDWQIEINEIKKDIKLIILNHKVGKRIASYSEYEAQIKNAFGILNEMPSDEIIQSFIDEFNLFEDWQIIINEVKRDINSLIIKHKVDKSISSYKEYLIQIKNTFGILDKMPQKKQIQEFIEEYNLGKQWGIVEEDISKDLEYIINGRYKDILKDSAAAYNNQVNININNLSNIYFPSVNRSTQKRTFQKNPSFYKKNKCMYEGERYSQSVSEKSSKIPIKDNIHNFNKNRKNIKKIKRQIKEIFLIDGDNHIKEAEKGIKNIPKDTRVRAFFSQEGAKRKFEKRHQGRANVSTKLVPPGNQAVDNQIKSEAGQEFKRGNPKIRIVSQDKGFDEYIKRKNDRSSRSNITRIKSVRDK